MNADQTARLQRIREQFSQMVSPETGDTAVADLLSGVNRLLKPTRARKEKEPAKPIIFKSTAWEVLREIVIHSSDLKQIKVTKVTLHAMELIDVRIWYRQSKGDVFMPARKGVTIDVKDRGALIEALQSIEM